MPTLLDLLDRCVAAGPGDVELGSTVIRVLRVDATDAAPGLVGAHDDDDDEGLMPAWFDDDDDVLLLDEGDGSDGGGPPGRWVLAVGECG
jgi:hypothetical protein